ncbi:MAG: TetR/AcrR family transcriptional regulator [Ginsengibacter sp.]|jgi:AcrR family transcriptional regulator
MKQTDFTDRQIEIMEAATSRIDLHGIQELTIKNLSSDIGVSEAALYRHFKSKNDIMMGLLTYFTEEMSQRVENIISNEDRTPLERLRDVFSSQLKAFVQKPAIVSVIFAEGIFNFNKELSATVSGIMNMMHDVIESIIKEGQDNSSISSFVGASTLATIIMGSMRITVLKWKITGHKSDLIKDGTKVLNGIFKMIKKES